MSTDVLTSAFTQLQSADTHVHTDDPKFSTSLSDSPPGTRLAMMGSMKNGRADLFEQAKSWLHMEAQPCSSSKGARATICEFVHILEAGVHWDFQTRVAISITLHCAKSRK